MEELIIVYNMPVTAKIMKKDKNKPWPNNDCSDATLLKYLGREGEKISRVKFTDEMGIGDGIIVSF